MYINGGGIWEWFLTIGEIGFGIYEISTGIGAADGVKNVIGGVFSIGAGIYQLLD